MYFQTNKNPKEIADQLLIPHPNQAIFYYSDLFGARFGGSNIQYAYFSEKDIHEISEQKANQIIRELQQDDNIDKNIFSLIKKNIQNIIKDKERYHKASKVYRELKNTFRQIGDGESESDIHYKERRVFTKFLLKKKES